ncbi:hypothetical protein [Sphingosinicella sp.]|uniref:hypothetical protein n=1 Tax=Sphingosinicella sp. TaxID=1917971 RepID=UPI004037B188
MGRAVWAFAALEAVAIRLCERLQPGSLDLLEERTAGRVADKLLSLTLKEDSPKAARIAAARRFQALVRSRNNLLHSKPGLAREYPRLLRDGDAWSQAEIEAIAAAFQDCAALLETED